MIMKNEFTKLAQSNPALRHDPFVRSMIRRESRQAEQDRMHLMNQFPCRSGWIILLHNRVSLNSVGNVQYQTRYIMTNTQRWSAWQRMRAIPRSGVLD